MSYFITHHGSYWFRMRVPRRHVARYGRAVRINLQTTDRTIARSLALRLAADWLSRFGDPEAELGADPAAVPPHDPAGCPAPHPMADAEAAIVVEAPQRSRPHP